MFCLGLLGELQGSQGHCHVLWLELLFTCSFLFPPIIHGKYTLDTLVLLNNVLPGAWVVDCGSVAMVTSWWLGECCVSLLPL